MFNRRRPQSFSGKVVAVSGAGSGIGRALCERLLGEGAQVAMGEVDGARLAETARQLDPTGRRVLATTLDVSDRAAVTAWADAVVARFGVVHMVVNNAGVTRFDRVAEVAPEQFERLMAVNFWGVIHGTQAFLPHLSRADAGHVVNVSSVFGLFAFPSQGAYCASKFAVRGFTEALAEELSMANSRVRVTCVHPSGIASRIARDAQAGQVESLLGDVGRARDFFDAKLGRMTADEAAAQILDGVRRGRRRVLVGPGARLFDVMQRVSPEHYGHLVETYVRLVRWRHLGGTP